MEKNFSKELLSCIQGDVTILKKIKALSHESLCKLYEEIAPVFISKRYVYNAINNLKDGRIKENDLQEWASFIRRGYLKDNSVFPVSPLKIDYQPEDEELIIEAIAKLDQLGDKIDGEISPAEILALLNYLT